MKTQHLVIMFIASLMLNAFLGGLMLSGCVDREHMPFPQMGKGFGKGDMGPPKDNMFFQRMTEQAEKLSPDGQKKVGKIVGKYEKDSDKKSDSR